MSFPRSAILAVILVVLLCAVTGFYLGPDCRSADDPTRLCLGEDLGGYRLAEAKPLAGEEPGCLATYRRGGPKGEGEVATVEVRRGGAEPEAEGWTPYEFEKNVVLHRRAEGGVEIRWHRGDHRVRVFLGGHAVPEGPVLRAYLFEYRSEVAVDRAELQQQVDSLKEVSQSRPKDAEVHLQLARKYRELANQIMAVQEYHIAIDADRGCTSCYLELGSLYHELRHWDLAIRAFRRAVALQPADPGPLIWLGDVYYEVHNGQEALKAYRAAVSLGVAEDRLERTRQRIQELEAGKYMLEPR